ncbi:MAG: hypothetical protein LAN64_01785 [Acidobacteriia bacterium]|nr:hypothetical protein [Terriglobia bacterium]
MAYIINLNDTNPAPPAGKANVKWQKGAVPADPSQPVPVSAYADSGGSLVLYGTVDPTTEGNNGDFYINTTSHYLFGPKASGTWPAGTALIGPTGATGATGANGTNGTNGTVASRANVVYTTGTIAAGAYETGSMTIAKSFAIVAVTVDRSCRVRLYSTAAQRNADISRGTYSLPAINTSHGVIMDFVLDGSASAPLSGFICSPEVYGANGDGSPTSSIYYTITNNTASPSTVTVTLVTKIEEA